MSHIIKAKAKINTHKLMLLKQCVDEAGGSWSGLGTHHLYSSDIQGAGFLLPGWRYPVVIQEDGTVAYDNYNGVWGDKKTLQNVLNNFTAKGIIETAQQNGYSDIQQTETQREITIVLTQY